MTAHPHHARPLSPWPNRTARQLRPVASETALGQHLHALRVQHGLSLRELARRSGVGADTINDLERGVVAPRPATVERVLAALEGEG